MARATVAALVAALAAAPSAALLPAARLSLSRPGPLARASAAAAAAVDKAEALEVGSQPLDWANLGFQYRQARCHVEYTWRDGSWDAGRLVDEPYLRLHVGATALHYGQAAFEGLKAFAQKDGSVRLFRPDENAKRMRASAKRSMMAEVPEELFLEAVKRAVAANRDYVPPYGSGGSLYVRPLLIGSGERIGLQPAPEYTFVVLVVPVGAYYKGDGPTPVPCMVVEGYDRAAPRGVGNVKVAGNYAADLLPNALGRDQGYPIGLYLDAATRTKVEEFSTSNFIAVSKDGRTYATPDSDAVLPSITNKSLMELAKANGLEVQRRPIAIDEVFDGKFSEIAACGTAVVVTPIKSLVHGTKVVEIGEAVGPVTKMLYDQIRAIQDGDAPDTFGWTVPVP